ncbi:hypothetical protein [Streptomyces sp. A1547]|nr:hypothetical protein [Streptomyces sp. A1547]
MNDDTHADYLYNTAGRGTHTYLFNGGDPSGPDGWTYTGTIR